MSSRSTRSSTGRTRRRSSPSSSWPTRSARGFSESAGVEKAFERFSSLVVRVPVDHVPARHLDDLDEIAEREPVRVDLFLAHEPALPGVQQERWDAQALGRRRWSAELPVHRDDRAPAIVHSKTSIGVVHEMLAHLLLEELAWCRGARVEPGGDPFLGRGEGLIGTLELRE